MVAIAQPRRTQFGRTKIKRHSGQRTDWKFSKKSRYSIQRSLKTHDKWPVPIIWHGSVRSAKTITSLITWCMYVENYAPAGDLLMSGKTERTLIRNILSPLRDIVGTNNFKLNKGAGELTLFNRLIYLVGANDDRAEEKIRGMTLAGSYADEGTILPKSFMDQLVARHSLRGGKIFVTTNPDSPKHWLKTNYIDNADGESVIQYPFNLTDNLSLEPGYTDTLKLLYSGLFYKRMVQGLWIVAEGAVYYFDEDKHLIKLPLNPAKHYDVAVDYGTSNPTVFGLFGTRPTGHAPHKWLERTYYHHGAKEGQKTDAHYVGELKEWLGDTKPRSIIVDPSAASFKVELRKNGFYVVDAVNDLIDGIRVQSALLDSGHYAVVDDSSNQVVLDEYYSYVWDPKRQEKGEDRPVKANDHTLDMQRYYLNTIEKVNRSVVWGN